MADRRMAQTFQAYLAMHNDWWPVAALDHHGLTVAAPCPDNRRPQTVQLHLAMPARSHTLRLTARPSQAGAGRTRWRFDAPPDVTLLYIHDYLRARRRAHSGDGQDAVAAASVSGDRGAKA